jgi:hypothetical protein
MMRRKTDQVEMSYGTTVTGLVAVVTGDDESAKVILKQNRAFIDGKQADPAAPLADGTQVIFMRPISEG